MNPATDDDALLDELQRESFDYFLHEVNPRNGLVADKTDGSGVASIAATGLALAAYPVGVERGFMTRDDAARLTLATLRFFRDAPYGPESDATGYHGFYYHFLDMQTGRRVWQSEISTVDTAFLLAGCLTCAQYFKEETEQDASIRALATELYGRAEWTWAQDRGATITHGWTPEYGFLPYRWSGYDEALLLYILALGSPTHSVPPESYAAWLSTYSWKTIYGHDLVYAGPLFIHQLSQIWIDCRGIQDDYMRARHIDYFENSRRATLVQREYAVRNPLEFERYGERCWGLTASDGPGPRTCEVRGIKRTFFNYVARGAPYGPDDGTVAPWAVVASLPFAPDVVMPTIRYFHEHLRLKQQNPFGFKATFNPTYPDKSNADYGWISPFHVGLNQGPIVLMIENYRSGLLWRLMQRCPAIVNGLRRACFTGAWL